MYTKEQIRQAFSNVFRGAGELWFPYAGRDEDIMQPVDEHWQKLETALSSSLHKGLARVEAASTTGPCYVCGTGELGTKCDYHDVVGEITHRTPDEEDHDALTMAQLARDLDAAPTPPRVLVVGARRFRRDMGSTEVDPSSWTWAQMLRYPAMTAERTPLAWGRLTGIGLPIADAVDLLPPGGEIDDAQAAAQARYLQGVLAGLEAADQGYDVVVLLGGKVSKAFRAADSRLHDLRLLELRHGFITLPTPHVVEQDADGWWSNEAKLSRLRSIVGSLMSWRCEACVNSDTEETGCVECGTHSRGCAIGGFCVQCRRRGSASEVSNG